MKELIELTNDEAREYFLKSSSYFSSDLPPYISFEPLLSDVSHQLNGRCYPDYRPKNIKLFPQNFSDVNYLMLTNKDGKFDWRPLELIHPVIYVSLVNLLCEPDNWELVQTRWAEFQGGRIECCSSIVAPDDNESSKAAQVKKWWNKIEQQSLRLSLEFSHVLHTDVTNCYGSLYTHSIAWAIHGYDEAKKYRTDHSYLGNHLDALIRAGRNGQTNGISQGSTLMDFIAELVLGYVDEEINSELINESDLKILRYRDDYRIFANSDGTCEKVLKSISGNLLKIGMKLGNPKSFLSRNVVEGSVKPDKLAGIELQDIGEAQAKTIQKQLLRLHSFGQRFPNSGALRRLVSEYHENVIENLKDEPEDLEVLVSIATDIGFVSPSTFPAIAAILSKLISLSSPPNKTKLWKKVKSKMDRVPGNGYLEIWLQRVVTPKNVDLQISSKEAICKIVKSEANDLWNNDWINDPVLKNSVDPSKILIEDPSTYDEVIQLDEIDLFRQHAWLY